MTKDRVVADPKTFELAMSSYVFDGSHPSMFRDRQGKFDERAPNYDDRYDFHTFVYDCFYRADVNEVWLLCPRLLNFVGLVRDMTFFVDGSEHSRVKIENISRATVIKLKGVKTAPTLVRFEHEKASGDLTVGDTKLDLFAGKNAVFSINKDNRLEWIQDWLRFYVRVHGLNAMALVDNGSTTYTVDDLRAAIDEVEGIDQACVISAPFPFGPNAEGQVNTSSLYLQRSTAEIIRRRLFKNCRAVLNVDIDELIFSWSGQSIFDATAASDIGFVRANAEWVYVDEETAAKTPKPLRHVHHTNLSVPRKPGAKRLPKANRKWCVDPNGKYGEHQWLMHFLDNQKDPLDLDFLMLHCRQISTSWKYERGGLDGIALEPFPELEALMAKTFPEYL